MVDDEPVALGLELDDLADRGRDQVTVRDQVSVEFFGDLLRRQPVRVEVLLPRQTGVSMNRLVSYAEEHTPALQALDAGVAVVGA